MRKAFAYLRVSTEGQIERDGFPRQRQAVLAYAALHNIEIVRFFEEAVSGADDAIDRPVFTELQNALDSNGVKLVLIEKLDRLARSVRVQENIIFHFQQAHWEIISTKEPDLCSKEPERAMFRQMMGLVAEYDRANITRRLRLARDRASKARGQRVEGRRKIDQYPEAQVALTRMRELQAQGLSFCAIAATLNAEGIKTRKQLVLNRGTGWFASNIARYLRRVSA
jgi:DNA invertase Pin-like site-specific DNA recombinase